MLHPVKPPLFSPLLREVLEFEKKLLKWICTPPIEFTFDGVEKSLRNKDQAVWLWDRIQQGKKFRAEVETAIHYIRENPSAGNRIMECAKNDLNFHEHFADTNFLFYERRFLANQITLDDFDAFNPMLVSLYGKIFNVTGFPPSIHKDSKIGNLTRSKWNEDFWISNSSLNFCPACGGQKPRKTLTTRTINIEEDDENKDKTRRLSNVDHFFPKEKYPFLSIHPSNLIPICMECNKYKLDCDPLDATNNLLDIFHSYYSPAIAHIKLHVTCKPDKKITVTIYEKDGTRSKRVNNFVRVFDLETCWADWFEMFIDTEIATLQGEYSKEEKKENLKYLLEDELKNNLRYSSTRPNCFVYAGLLQYILDSPTEFENLCESFGVLEV